MSADFKRVPDPPYVELDDLRYGEFFEIHPKYLQVYGAHRPYMKTNDFNYKEKGKKHVRLCQAAPLGCGIETTFGLNTLVLRLDLQIISRVQQVHWEDGDGD